MPDYSKGKIYKLVSNYTDDIYIGSTCNTLSRRKGEHKCNYMRYIDGKGRYVSSFKLFEKGNVDVVLIEECSVHNKMELHRKEREYIEKLVCVNKCIPGRTKKEYDEVNKDKRKEHYENNIDKVKQYYIVNKDKAKKYHEINKDKRNQQARQRYQKKKLESLNFALDSEI